MSINPGDPVIVDFDGLDHRGILERIDHGWARCLIMIDPEADYGSGTERLDPLQHVCVPVGRVTKAD